MEEKRTFDEIQERQKWNTFLLLLPLIVLYLIGIGGIYVFFLLLILGGVLDAFQFSFWHIFIIFLLAAGLGISQWLDAKYSGTDFILKRLNARKPDKNDLYHKRAMDILQEMRIAAGYDKFTKLYVVPANAINSFALTEPDGTPVVGVTEGALSRLTRDEIQAAIAHELAHIMRGDAVYVTFVCSLTNIFQKIEELMEGSRDRNELLIFYRARPENVVAGFAGRSVAGLFSGIMRFMTFLVSREREYMADATAVEFTRQPEALARAILKAHRQYSFLGFAGESYSPIFIVSPESRGNVRKSGFWEKLLATHPPTMDRIKRLVTMDDQSLLSLYRKAEETETLREKARVEIPSEEEKQKYSPGMRGTTPLEGTGDEIPKGGNGNAFEVRDQKGQWIGPYNVVELLALPWFTALSRVRIPGTSMEVPARSFSQIVQAFRKPGGTSHEKGRCPVCASFLKETHYEGVPIRICHRCGGRLVPEEGIVRIVSRREYKPSPYLLEKARKWKEENKLNPLYTRPRPTTENQVHCPLCGRFMLRKLFSYQYFVEVDYCGICKAIWFDADELEILQILIEEAGY